MTNLADNLTQTAKEHGGRPAIKWSPAEWCTTIPRWACPTDVGAVTA
jgi:hypothetical protein